MFLIWKDIDRNHESEVYEIMKEMIPSNAIFLVDAVTILGTMNIEVDKWGIDAIYSCSQKGLSCPPGASPISFSQKAIATPISFLLGLFVKTRPNTKALTVPPLPQKIRTRPIFGLSVNGLLRASEEDRILYVCVMCTHDGRR